MRRWQDSRARRRQSRHAYLNPAISLSADFAWRADGCATSGGLVTQWTPYRGAVALAQATSTLRMSAPAADPLLGGRLSCSGAGKYYTGTVPLGDAQTVAIACSVTTDTAQGPWSSSNGSVNTGTSVLVSSPTRAQARRLGNVETLATGLTFPLNSIMVAVLTTTSAKFYVSARTPFTASTSTASIAQSSFALGALTPTGSLPFTGSIAEIACWNSALSQSQVEVLLVGWGKYYRLPIAA